MIISLICGLLCVYLGFNFSSKVKKEKRLLKSLIRFNKSILINFEYEKKSILEFVKGYKDKELNELIAQFSSQLKKGREISISIQDKSIKKEVDYYLSNLGKSDSVSQIEFVKGYEKIFQNYYEEFCQNGNKKIALYPKLGFLVGGIVFIMLL